MKESYGLQNLDMKTRDNIIVILPWDEWILSQDDSSSHIALLPLHPDLRAKFNETAAWEYALSMAGKPYGFHNLIFSWIDTIDGNYPPPLDAHLVASVMTVWNQLQPAYAANIWNEALNKRLGTQALPKTLVETERRGTSFDELLTIPEQDNWVYSDGLSTSCIAFVLEMYKEAGIFGPLASSIQVTEFTIKDAYTLKFFENNSSRLPKWCNNDGDPVKLPFCQIKEKYRMELPEYNTMELYSHMNETCPSLPPKYYRPRVVESLLICFSCLGLIQIKDAYTLKFFKNNSSCLPKWCNNDGDPVKLPFCQIKGKYQMELPEYNTMELYSHMNESQKGHYMIEVSVMTAILVSVAAKSKQVMRVIEITKMDTHDHRKIDHSLQGSLKTYRDLLLALPVHLKVSPDFFIHLPNILLQTFRLQE
ncbi:unnamed protein product [Camellia sinensis]